MTKKTKRYKDSNQNWWCTIFCTISTISQLYRTCSAHTFPEDFLFGVSSAAYQIEGAWNTSGRGESIWDRFIHNDPHLVHDVSNADIAADSYHHLEDDVQILRELGVQFYRFSISWSRLYPDGTTNKLNKEGVNYYHLLIRALVEANIIPFVTMYHWDLPQKLQDLGGWTNPLMTEYFLEYADTLFELYGDYVKYWTTFNEPIYQCAGYTSKDWAPGIVLPGIANYICNHIILKTHGKVYRLYQQKYKKYQQGLIGITIGFPWYESKSNSTLDQNATQRAFEMDPGIYAHPIVKTGDYSPLVKERIKQKSKEQHFRNSRLPVFSKQETEEIKNSYDFIGVNHYTSNLVREPFENETWQNIPSYEDDVGIIKEVNPNWPSFKARPSLKVYPKGFYKILKWIQQNYNDPLIFVTENGYADFGEENDILRVNYLKAYTYEMAKAIESGVKVRGYAHWSLLDNFEWLKGYTQRYGLYYVNMTDPRRLRTPKLSASIYNEVIKTREIKCSFCENYTYNILYDFN